jgi:hypothetical protein
MSKIAVQELAPANALERFEIVWLKFESGGECGPSSFVLTVLQERSAEFISDR